MTGSSLQRLRVELGLTQGACAREMSISRQTINSIENGRTNKLSSLKYYELYLRDVKRRKG